MLSPSLPGRSPLGTSAPGQNRQAAPRMHLFKIPVNVPPYVADFRAEYSGLARWLPPHLANVLIGAICTADAHGDDAVTTFEAISAATHTPGLQKRYKCKPTSPRQVERAMPELRELGVITWHSEKTRATGWTDDYGQVRSRIYLRLTIPNIDRLYELAEKARHEKAIRDTDRAALNEDYEQARKERRKIERARSAVVTCEDTEGINSCPTPIRGTNGGSSRGTDWGSSGGRIVPNQSFVTDRSFTDPSCSSSEPGCARGDGHASSSTESQNQDDDLISWAEDDHDEDGKTSRDYLASWLRVPVASIGAPLWRWLDGLNLKDIGPDAVALFDAAAKAVGAQNPVGYFQAVLPGQLAQARANAETRAAAAQAEAEALAAEAEAAQERAEREAAARDEILSLGIFRDGYLPKSVRRGVPVRTSADRLGLLGIWHHPEHDLAILSTKRDLNPGPGWEFVNAVKAEAERAERVQLQAA